MEKPALFHAGKEWYFGRTDDGGVVIRADFDTEGVADIGSLATELDADTWCSIVAFVSRRGEDHFTFSEARRLHKAVVTKVDLPPDPDDPLLGLATTRHLLEELRSRGQTEVFHKEAGGNLAAIAGRILEDLPHDMLTYRTVDS